MQCWQGTFGNHGYQANRRQTAEGGLKLFENSNLTNCKIKYKFLQQLLSVHQCNYWCMRSVPGKLFRVQKEWRSQDQNCKNRWGFLKGDNRNLFFHIFPEFVQTLTFFLIFGWSGGLSLAKDMPSTLFSFLCVFICLPVSTFILFFLSRMSILTKK